MSAYKKMKCKIVNREILLESLNELGLSYVDNTNKQYKTSYYGYGNNINDSEIIVKREELQKAFGSARNDCGFKWNEKDQEFDVIMYDGDTYSKMEKRFTQAYAKCALTKALEERNFMVESEGNMRTSSRNKVHVRAQIYI